MMGSLNTVLENDHPNIIFVKFGSIWSSGFIDDFQIHFGQISLHLHIMYPLTKLTSGEHINFDWLFDWCLTPSVKVFQLYRGYE
jgi:hypothetical protein